MKEKYKLFCLDVKGWEELDFLLKIKKDALGDANENIFSKLFRFV